MTAKLTTALNPVKKLVANVGMSRIIIFGFFFMLLFLTPLQEFPLSITNVLMRVGFNAVLVLSMLPSIKAGLGPNFAIPFGIIAGILGALIAIEIGLSGGSSFWVATFIGIVIAIPCGLVYGMLLNKVKGSEMMISTYFGYAVVAIMCIGWLVLPFSDPSISWVLGKGLRGTVSLDSVFGRYLSDMFSIEILYAPGDTMQQPAVLICIIGLIALLAWLFMIKKRDIVIDNMTDTEITQLRSKESRSKRNGFIVIGASVVVGLIIYFIQPSTGIMANIRSVFVQTVLFETPTQLFIPTGMLVFSLACMMLVWIYMRSKTGIAMSAVGSNPMYAASSGINVNKMRIIGATLSTVLAAVGILVYAQGFGFLQLYNAPMNMTFPPIAAILIGGASTKNAKITNVLIGVILFQGILTMGPPIAAKYLADVGGGNDPTEIVRIIITNGIILYALTKAGGGTREK